MFLYAGVACTIGTWIVAAVGYALGVFAPALVVMFCSLNGLVWTIYAFTRLNKPRPPTYHRPVPEERPASTQHHRPRRGEPMWCSWSGWDHPYTGPPPALGNPEASHRSRRQLSQRSGRPAPAALPGPTPAPTPELPPHRADLPALGAGSDQGGDR